MSDDVLGELAAGHGAEGAEQRVRSAAKDCVHCGFCLPACPTYQLWGEEMDSPRGRIHLVTQLLDGAPLTAATADHFDQCLGCMACMTACPSGVQYDQIIEAAREWTEAAGGGLGDGPPGAADGLAGAAAAGAPGGAEPAARRSLPERLTRAAIFALFPYPRRLRVAIAPLRLAQRTGADRLLARSGLVAALSPAADQALRLAPPAGRRLPPGQLPARVPSRGALSLHSGRAGEAIGFAQRTIETFEAAGVDTIVVNSAGCGSAMKEYARLFGQLATEGGDGLQDAASWAARAAALSARVRDLAEFLDLLGPVAERRPLPVRAAYHDACHLGHAQGITAAPRSLLRAIPGLDLVELRDAGVCCGSAGVYNLLQPDAAAALGSRKADSVAASGASLLISANPGCTLQISAALAQRGVALRAAHTAEILDASINGVPLS
jgi:glycolate oxidase iron-sulfur subunit